MSKSVADDDSVSRTTDFLDTVFANYPKSDFSFILWEGTEWRKPNTPTDHPTAFSIILNNQASLRRMFLPPSDTRLGFAYTVGEFDFRGDGSRMLDLGRHLWESWTWAGVLLSAYKLLRLPSSARAHVTPDDVGVDADGRVTTAGSFHSRMRDELAIRAHYDVSNEFYAAWLDERLVYSCAYFKSADDTLDQAQVNKLDICCRKLRLRKDDRLLDVGCGWGALVIHAAKNYGVRALGVTLSERQAALARQRVRDEGLADLVEIRLCDYRSLSADADGAFDAVVSVGMVEHVGRDNLGEYFRRVWGLLKGGGVFLNHGITLLHDAFKPQWQVRRGFFAKYIFPDGDVQPLAYVLAAAAAATRFEVRDVECLREHYARTLDCWYERFVAREDEMVSMVGRDMFRLWRLYLMGASWNFSQGLTSIYQTLFYKAPDDKPSADGVLPLTRDHLYS